MEEEASLGSQFAGAGKQDTASLSPVTVASEGGTPTHLGSATPSHPQNQISNSSQSLQGPFQCPEANLSCKEYAE